MIRAALLAALLVAAACDGSRSAAGDAGSPASSTSIKPPAGASAASLPAPTSPASGAASAAAGEGSLEVLRLALSSGVRDRAPVDRLVAAGPGQRVWAHLTVRNRTHEERGLKLLFHVDGQLRSTIDLDVEPSWSFRTWGYVTLRASDASGELLVLVRSDDGATLAEARLPIRPRPETRPRAP